ncbi:MAG TPA: glycosyltransferase, partial [Bryobacteraceae bacterium]|nr:glycosyltransferase [Bryobacteraceae bacterium]
MLLSILIPVYNERTVVERSLSLVLSAPLPENMERELVIVDDCSTDGTSEILDRLAASEPRIRLFRQPVNQGKGAAVRTAIQKAQGDFCLVQDADLEYDPSEYMRLLRPLVDGNADAVFGSRYLVSDQTRLLPYWHTVMNKGLTLLSNIFSNLNVSDMETCYKVFRTDLLKSIPIRSNRFGFEPEITMKCSKRQLRVYEVPISYHGRTYEEGKKIGWKDGVKALGVILYFWIVDDLYEPTYGRGLLNNLTGTPQYISWVTRILRPHLGDRVLEIGAGLGNLTGRLMARKLHYVAGEGDALYLHALRNRFLRTPNVTVCELHPEVPADYVPGAGQFDTALCVNVLETVTDPVGVLTSLRTCLAPGGS